MILTFYNDGNMVMTCGPEHCFSKYGLDQQGHHDLGTFQKCRISGSFSDLLSQSLHLDKIPRYFLYTLKFNKYNCTSIFTGDWFQEPTPTPEDTKIRLCSSPLYKMAQYSQPSHLWVPRQQTRRANCTAIGYKKISCSWLQLVTQGGRPEKHLKSRSFVPE